MQDNFQAAPSTERSSLDPEPRGCNRSLGASLGTGVGVFGILEYVLCERGTDRNIREEV